MSSTLTGESLKRIDEEIGLDFHVIFRELLAEVLLEPGDAHASRFVQLFHRVSDARLEFFQIDAWTEQNREMESEDEISSVSVNFYPLKQIL